MMISELARNWWALAIRGGLAVLFGLAAIAWPGPTLAVLLGIFGIFLVADGILAFVTAGRAAQAGQRWWVHVIEGLVDVGLGIAVFAVPGVTALILLYFVAFWAIFIGVWRVAASIELRREIQGEWLMAAAGIISILFGIALLAFPGAGALALVVFIGIYAVVFGVLSILLALRLRDVGEIKHEEFRKAA